MSKRRLPFRPRLEVLEDRLCPSNSTVELPISAFLSQQGTSTVFTPPVPDQLAFNNSIYDPGATPNAPGADRLILVDYTGQAAKYLLQHGINLHTQITGFVTETPIGPTGKDMEVSLNLEAVNALTWVADVPTADLDTPAVNTDPLELGYRPQDLVANPNLKPALSDVHFQFTFQEQTGAPLPDLVRALIIGDQAPPDFIPETVDFQSWGTGTLDAATTVGTPGQTAVVTTSQVGDLSQPNLPGTLPDGFFQEPVNIVPVQSPTSSIAYLNGELFITDLANGNDNISVNPAKNGGVTVSSNLGNYTYPSVNTVDVSLSGGNSNVQVGSLPGTLVNVAALDGNNNITIGNESEAVVSLGAGNDNITTGNVGVAQQIFVFGNANTNINAGTGDNVILVAGNGNHNLNAAGMDDSIEVLGNGNTNINDAGKGVTIFVGDAGNTNINAGASATINVLGDGNININVGAGTNSIFVSGNGNHNINAAGTDDSIEVFGNGNTNINDSGGIEGVMVVGLGNINISGPVKKMGA